MILFLMALYVVISLVLSIVPTEHADKSSRVLNALFGLGLAVYLLWLILVALRGVIAWLS